MFYRISFFVLTLAIKQKIELGIAYAVWAGLRAVFVTLIGVFTIHESMTFLQLFGIVIIIFDVIGLKLSSRPLTQSESQK